MEFDARRLGGRIIENGLVDIDNDGSRHLALVFRKLFDTLFVEICVKLPSREVVRLIGKSSVLGRLLHIERRTKLVVVIGTRLASHRRLGAGVCRKVCPCYRTQDESRSIKMPLVSHIS